MKSGTKFTAGVIVAISLWLGSVLLSLGIFVGIVWVAVHFIRKAW